MAFVAGREAEVVERLNPYQLRVLIQEHLPWYYDCTLWCPCEPGSIDIDRGVDDSSKVSQSTNLCVFLSVYEVFVSPLQ